jgi:hypothetical protein
VVQTGKRFIFGEPLKEMLFSAIRGPDGKPSRPVVITDQNARLWERAAGGARAAGINASEFPSTGDMWDHVTGSIKNGLNGLPSISKDHYPQLPPETLLELYWPFALKCLTGKVSGATAPFAMAVVEPRWWPTITGMVASDAIQKVKSVLHPRIALVIVMETAIYTLKIDPTTIEKAAGLTRGLQEAYR